MRQLFLSIKYYEDARNQAWVENLRQALDVHKIRLVCVAADLEHWGAVCYSVKELMQRTFEYIRNSDAVLVELSAKGVGVGIEAGYAAGCGIPVWVVALPGCEISETLCGIADWVYRYENVQDLADRIVMAMAELDGLG
jgi:hypothetical protein